MMTMKMILLMMLLMIMMDGLEDDDDSDDDDAGGGGGGGLTRPDVPPMLSNLGLQRLHLNLQSFEEGCLFGAG